MANGKPTSTSKGIHQARVLVGLTQTQLARRLGLVGRAVSRWELGDAEPSKRHRAALVTTFSAINPQVAESLRAVLFPSATPVAAPTTPSLTSEQRMELALFHLADELDLPARRLRGPLVRYLKRLHGEFTLESAQQLIETWIANGP